MNDIEVIVHSKPDMRSPVLVEGLPGVGNVGKLAAEHLAKSIGAEKFASIFSKHLPPQVLIGENGVVRLVSNDLYYYDFPDGPELMILVGDYQGTSQEGQYDLASHVLDMLEQNGGSTAYTLGGWSVGKIVMEPRVLGAATSDEMVNRLKESGVEFSRDEPAGGIVGAAGLILGLGQLRDIDAACLMGETSGYFSDPKSAQAVLEILARLLDIEIDFTELEQHTKEIDDLTSKLDEMKPQADKQDSLEYIG